MEEANSALLAWAVDNHQEVHIPAKRILHKSCGSANPSGWAQISEHGSHMGTSKQKANTVRHQHNKMVEGSTLKEKIHLSRSQGIISISLRRHPQWGCCCCGTITRPTELHTMSHRINFGGRTTSCWPNTARSKISTSCWPDAGRSTALGTI